MLQKLVKQIRTTKEGDETPYEEFTESDVADGLATTWTKAHDDWFARQSGRPTKGERMYARKKQKLAEKRDSTAGSEGALPVVASAADGANGWADLEHFPDYANGHVAISISISQPSTS